MNLLVAFFTIIVCSISTYANTPETYLGDAHLDSVVTKKISLPNVPIDEIHSYAQVRVTLYGCLDEFGPITVAPHFDNKLQKFRLNVSVTGIRNPKSEVVKCVRAPDKIVQVYLGPRVYFEENIEVKTLSFNYNDSLF